MSKTLYVSDLDGTLLNSRGDLSPVTIGIINDLIADGMLFSYATARSYCSASKKTEKLNLNLPVITNNGTFLLEPKTGKPIFYHKLDKTALPEIYEIVKAQRIGVMVYALFDGVERASWVRGTETGGVLNYLESRKGDTRFKPLETYDNLFDGDVFYLTFIDDYKNMSALYKRFSGLPGCSVIMQEDVYTRDEYWLEILSSDASKGDAVTRLKQMLGCDRIIAFGDNLNDLTLFGASNAGYATANASEVLKAAAKGLTESNDNDGVAKWIKENFYSKGNTNE